MSDTLTVVYRWMKRGFVPRHAAPQLSRPSTITNDVGMIVFVWL